MDYASGQPQQPRIPNTDSTEKPNLVRSEGIAITLLIILILFILNFLNVVPLYKLAPRFFGWLPHFPTTQSTAQKSQAMLVVKPDLDFKTELENCLIINSKNNPLVTFERVKSGIQEGYLYGTAANVVINKDVATVDLVSAVENQQYSLQTRIVYDTATKKEVPAASTVKKGQSLQVFYTCNPQAKESKFAITKVSIIKK